MKIRQIQDSQNQHVVAVELNGELRCYMQHASSHVISVTAETLSRDIARHGNSIVQFDTLPKITCRKSQGGKDIFDVAAIPGDAIAETVENANALLRNVGLHTYDQLLDLLDESLLVLRVSQVKGAGHYVDKVVDALGKARTEFAAVAR